MINFYKLKQRYIAVINFYLFLNLIKTFFIVFRSQLIQNRLVYLYDRLFQQLFSEFLFVLVLVIGQYLAFDSAVCRYNRFF